MSSVTIYDVQHREFALLLKGGLYVGLPTGHNGELDVPREAAYCSMLVIAAIEVLPAK